MTPPPAGHARGRSPLPAVRPPDLPAGELRRAGRAPSDSPPRRLRRRARPSRPFRREVPALVGASVLLALVLRALVLQAFFIPSASMVPTLSVGDRVLVEKVSYRFRDPARGDVVVFHQAGTGAAAGAGGAGDIRGARDTVDAGVGGTLRGVLEDLSLLPPAGGNDLIKRVIGLPGDRVELVDGVVFVNGRRLEEPYTRPDTRDYPAVTVPDGEYFVLGDNRTDSLDSRFGLGTIPAEALIGRAFMILWPPADARVDLGEDYQEREPVD